jgi:hypothetical protein
MESKSTYFPPLDAARVDALCLRKCSDQTQHLKVSSEWNTNTD